jgi:predicted ATP-grasp superfamily ATP-dependent carboligase
VINNPSHKTKNFSPPAVIAGASQTGVLGVRSLQRQGIHALCFDCNKHLPGFKSVYGPARLCPDPDTDPQGWVNFMKDLAHELKEKAVLIPSSDRYVTALSQHQDILVDHFIICSGIALQGSLAQKQTQYELAMTHGMPMPVTGMINNLDELREFSNNLTFPCILKPWHFREWELFSKGHPLSNKKIVIVENEEDLISNYNLAAKVNPKLIVQDIIHGADTDKRVYLACYDRSSKRIANAMFKELRCVPIGYGPASVCEPVVDPEADKICNDFLSSIGYVGICEIEVKRDIKDGKVKLIEANPRLSGSGDAAPYAGVDLCHIHYLDMIGHSVDPVQPSTKFFRHIVFRAEGRAIPEYMRAGLLTWKELFKSYKPPLAFYDLDLRDWKCTLETLLVTVKTLLSQLINKKNKTA